MQPCPPNRCAAAGGGLAI